MKQLEDLFIDIETVIGGAEDYEVLRNIKMEYFRNHRLTVKYFTQVQVMLDDELEIEERYSHEKVD